MRPNPESDLFSILDILPSLRASTIVWLGRGCEPVRTPSYWTPPYQPFPATPCPITCPQQLSPTYVTTVTFLVPPLSTVHLLFHSPFLHLSHFSIEYLLIEEVLQTAVSHSIFSLPNSFTCIYSFQGVIDLVQCIWVLKQYIY